MVQNIDVTIMGHKIETRKHPRHGTQLGCYNYLLYGVIQYPTNRNLAIAPSLQQNAITEFGPRLHNSLPKYLRHIESVKMMSKTNFIVHSYKIKF